MAWKPNTVVAAVIEREGKFLVVKERSEGRLVYNQPAGHLDENEGLLTAVRREVLEETGWHFDPTALVGVYLWKHPAGHTTYLRFCFTGVVMRHDADRPLDDGIVAALWLSRQELLAQEDQLRSPLVLRCIDDYLAGVRHPLTMLHHVTAL